MKRQRIDTTTIEVTTGTKYRVRKMLTPRILALISSASSSAKPACRGTTTTAKYKVLRSDFQNSGSLNSREKFSNPMIFAGSGEISRALVNASAKHSPTGTKKKTISSSMAGLTMSAPVRPSRPRPARLVVAGASVRRPPFGGISCVTAMALSKVARRRWAQVSIPPTPSVRRGSGSVVVVALEVLIDVLGRLIQDLLGVTTRDDVLGRLGEGGRNVGIGRRRRPDQRELLRLIEEEPLVPALLPAGRHGCCLLGRRNEVELGHELGEVLGLERELQIVQRAGRVLAAGADAPLPGATADLRTRTEVRRQHHHAIFDLLEVLGAPAARPNHGRLAVDEVGERVGPRLGRRVLVLDQALEPVRPGHGLVAIEHTGGGGIGVAVDQVPAEALQERRVAVGPPLRRGVTGAQIQHMLVLAGGLDLLQGLIELLGRPGLVDGGHWDPGGVKRRLARKQPQRGVVVADRVQLVVPLAERAGQLLVDHVLGQVELGQVAGPGPVRNDRGVHVQDAGQLLGGRSSRHGDVIGSLREGLDLDLVLGLAGVVVLDDLVDDGQLYLVAGVVGPQGELPTLATPASAARGSAPATGEYQHSDQRHYTGPCEGPRPMPSHDRFLRSTAQPYEAGDGRSRQRSLDSVGVGPAAQVTSTGGGATDLRRISCPDNCTCLALSVGDSIKARSCWTPQDPIS